MARKPERSPATSPHSVQGERSSRLDAFVDAAFAFAVTLLVISADRIPDTLESLLLALKTVRLPCGSGGAGAMLGATRDSVDRVFLAGVAFEFKAALQ